MSARVTIRQLCAVIVATNRTFHVVARRFGQDDRVLGTVKVKHGLAGLIFFNKAPALRCLIMLLFAVRKLDRQINKGSKRSGHMPRRALKPFYRYVFILNVHTCDRPYKGTVKQAKWHTRNGKRNQHDHNVRTYTYSGRYQCENAIAQKENHKSEHDQKQHARCKLFDHRCAHVTLKVTWQADLLLWHDD